MDTKPWPRSQAEWVQHAAEWNHQRLQEWWARNKERFSNAEKAE